MTLQRSKSSTRGLPLYRETFKLPQLSFHHYVNLCGPLHENITLLENFFHLKIQISFEKIVLMGESKQSVDEVKELFETLHSFADQPISATFLKTLLHQKGSKIAMTQSVKLSHKSVLARNPKQTEYLNGIETHDITLGIGPAGTGKTFLAVSKAVEAFEKGEVHRLIFARPAVEAGEKLGFLPGDLVEKVLPYLRPIYDALYEMLGYKEVQKLIQSDIIEILPLAFMRGRTFNEAFIILDEAQNTTILQMKMFLTRMGLGSKMVITGDLTQIDLPREVPSGLVHALKLLAKAPDIYIHTFTSREVVRHPLVAQVIELYDQDEELKRKS